MLLLAVGCSSSAHGVHARYAGAATGTDTATLVIQFTGEVTGAHLVINGTAVATGAHTRQITVEDVPSGDVAVMLAADGGVEKAFMLHLDGHTRTVVPIAAPPEPKTTNPIIGALLSVAVYAAYQGVGLLF
ncbi:MAG TPA: hypothetical protein VFG83_05505 [Kofleriaceae bacterium]|nr:hypothetical protein [Kofleriaceae bacterium]